MHLYTLLKGGGRDITTDLVARRKRRSVQNGRVPFEQMAVGIEEVDLRIAGGRVGLDNDFEGMVVGVVFVEAGGVQFFDCGAEAGNAKRDVRFVNFESSGRAPERGGDGDDVEFLAARELEPRAGEIEGSGARKFGEAEEIAVEGAGSLEVGDGEL